MYLPIVIYLIFRLVCVIGIPLFFLNIYLMVTIGDLLAISLLVLSIIALIVSLFFSLCYPFEHYCPRCGKTVGKSGDSAYVIAEYAKKQ